jgi:hypothetical protein
MSGKIENSTSLQLKQSSNSFKVFVYCSAVCHWDQTETKQLEPYTQSTFHLTAAASLVLYNCCYNPGGVGLGEIGRVTAKNITSVHLWEFV